MAKATPTKDLIVYFEKLDLTEFKPGGKKYLTASQVKTDPPGTIEKICSIYYKIRPFLKAILLIPFIPKKIKEAIKIFMDMMDKLCPERK